MARNRKLQRLARERMKRTGEKYTTALRAIEAEADSKPLGPGDFSAPRSTNHHREIPGDGVARGA
jgi:hypothetical protein